jgi:hypothetical protein
MNGGKGPDHSVSIMGEGISCAGNAHLVGS